MLRPPNGLDLFNLTFSVTALELAGPWFTTAFVSQLFPDVYLQYGIFVFLYPIIFFAIFHWLPALLTALYFVFGNRIFIFNWVDSFLVFVIQYLLSILTPMIFLIEISFLVIYFIYNPGSKRLYTATWSALYLLQVYALQTATMLLSVNAIKYLDPAWDMEEPGEYLWPAILYWLRIKEHTGRKKQVSTKPSDSSESKSIEGVEIEDEVSIAWTL